MTFLIEPCEKSGRDFFRRLASQFAQAIGNPARRG
jgi:hypothetical protein